MTATSNRLEVSLAAIALVLLTGTVLFVPWKMVLAAVVAIPAAVTFFARPREALLAVFALRVIVDLFHWLPLNMGGLNLLEGFGGGVAALAAVLFYLELKRVERTPGFMALALYLAVLVVAALRSGEVRDAAEILAKYISPLLLLFLVASYMDTTALRKRFLWVVTAAGCVSLSVSTYHLATGQMAGHFRQGYFRLVGGYANLHNHALFLMVLNSLFFFWLMTLKKPWQRALMLGLQGLGLLCMYNTYVRTAMTGFAVFVFVFLWLEKRYELLGLAFVAGAGLLLTNESLQDRFSDVTAVFGAGDSLGSKRTLGSGRFGIWTMSFAEFLKQPPTDIVLGLGLGGHYEMTDLYADLYRSQEKSDDLDSHNDYLSLLYQLGPIALVCYVWLQVTVLRVGWQLHRTASELWTRRLARYMVALTCVTFVTNFLSNSFIQRVTVAWLFWGVVGVLFACWRAEETRKEAEQRGVVVPLEQVKAA